MGLVTTVFDERTLSGSRGHLAIGHTRYSTPGSANWTPPSRCSARLGAAGFALGAQRQPDQHRRRWPRRRACCRARCSSDSDLVAELLARRPRRRCRATGDRRGSTDGAAARCCPRRRGAFSLRAPRRRPPLRRCATRTASGPLCLGRLGTADAPEGWVSPRSRRRSTSSAPPSCASSSPARWSVIDDDGVRSEQLFPTRAGRPEALHLRVRLLRPARRHLYGHEVHGDPPAHGRAAGRAGAGRGRPGDGRARLRGAGRRGLRQGRAASPTARDW